jgi:hypothetical protein
MEGQSSVYEVELRRGELYTRPRIIMKGVGITTTERVVVTLELGDLCFAQMNSHGLCLC